MAETATATNPTKKTTRKAQGSTAAEQNDTAEAPAPAANASPVAVVPTLVKPERPEQIVITMSEELKVAIQKKCKSEKTPVARKVRKMLQDWVDGKIDLPAAAVKAAQAETTQGSVAA